MGLNIARVIVKNMVAILDLSQTVGVELFSLSTFLWLMNSPASGLHQAVFLFNHVALVAGRHFDRPAHGC